MFVENCRSLYYNICIIYTVDQILYLVGDTTLLQLTTDFEKRSKIILVSVCVGGACAGGFVLHIWYKSVQVHDV